MEVVERLSFRVEGEWITDLARSWFWDENKDYEVVEELLLSCLCTDEITIEERKDIARDIIEGKKKLVGINNFSLEDDGHLIRPIYKKIQELKRKEEIRKIKDDMDIHANNYIDKFSIDFSLDTYNQNCEADSYYSSYDGAYEFFYNEDTFSETKNGLWILDKPELVFDLMGGVVDNFNKEEFFNKLYEYLKEQSSLSEGFLKRQKRYEQSLRVGKVEEVGYFYKPSLPDYNETDYMFGKPELNYCRKYDDLLSEYAWINRYGEWHSCEFGGHQLKAEVIVTMNEKLEKEFNLWLEENGEIEEVNLGDNMTYKMHKVKLQNSNWYVSGDEVYSEFLLRKGWIKFHNPHMGECFPEYYLKPTREQNDAMFKASLKFGYKKIQGLDVEN